MSVATRISNSYLSTNTDIDSASRVDESGYKVQEVALVTGVANAEGQIAVSSAANNTLVAASASGKRIRVYSLFLLASGTVSATFNSGAAARALTGRLDLTAQVGFTLPYNPDGWFTTDANAALTLTLAQAIYVGGCFKYALID